MKFKLFGMLALLLLVGAAKLEQRPLTIMGVGDSLTHRGDSYLPALRELIRADGDSVQMIGPNSGESRFGEFRHAGFPGKNAEYIAQVLDTIYRRYSADVILLQCGHNHSSAQKPVVGIIKAYRTMINTVLKINPSAKIFVAEIVPSGKLPKYEYIPELNRAIISLIKELDDRRVVYVAVANGFSWQRHTIDDRVHPNTSGGELMANNWWKGIGELFK